jgi:hypothetical protein
MLRIGKRGLEFANTGDLGQAVRSSTGDSSRASNSAQSPERTFGFTFTHLGDDDGGRSVQRRHLTGGYQQRRPAVSNLLRVVLGVAAVGLMGLGAALPYLIAEFCLG